MTTATRRQFLKTTGAAASAVALAGCLLPPPPSATGGGAGSLVPMGGNVAAGGVGSGYAYETPEITEADTEHTVTSADQLDAALDTGTPENPTSVWVPPDAAIDYSGRDREITHGVIASSRSVNHRGGIIYSNSMGTNSTNYRGGDVDGMFRLGDGGRLTGLRLRGPTSSVWDHPLFPGYIPFGSGSAQAREAYREARHSRGVTIVSGNASVDNCEVFGWSTHGITVDCPRSYGVAQEQSYPQIRNSSIHDCGMSGHGYGVNVIRGHPVCQRIFLNGTRHAIAGYGYPDGGYSLADSSIGPANSLFQCDMHYIGENSSGSSSPSSYEYRYHSGGLIRIIRTTFTSSHVIDIASTESISQGGNPFAGNPTPAISIGGLPAQGVEVKGNRFVHDSVSSAISQGHVPGHAETDANGFARIEYSNNQFGINPGYDVGQG